MPDPFRPTVSSTGAPTAAVPARGVTDHINAAYADGRDAVKRPSSKMNDEVTGHRDLEDRDRDGFPD